MTSKHRVPMLIACLAGASSAHAAPELVSADMAAQGGVSLAADTSNAAITSNPGMIALNKRYDFSAQFGFGPSRGLHWGVTGMDGRTSDYVAMGFSYSGDRHEPPLTTADLPGWSEVGTEVTNIKRSHDFAVALGTAFADDMFSVGVGGHLSLYNNDRSGQGTLGNVDVGVGFKPSELFTFGVSGNNLVPWDPLDDRPLQVAGGARIDGYGGALEVDGGYVQPPNNATEPPLFVAGGGELRPGTGRIRAGYRYDAVGTLSTITAGLGLTAEGGSIEYGINIPIGTGWAGVAHVVGFRFGAPPGISDPG